jgi:hypothetical protein
MRVAESEALQCAGFALFFHWLKDVVRWFFSAKRRRLVCALTELRAFEKF